MPGVLRGGCILYSWILSRKTFFHLLIFWSAHWGQSSGRSPLSIQLQAPGVRRSTSRCFLPIIGAIKRRMKDEPKSDQSVRRAVCSCAHWHPPESNKLRASSQITERSSLAGGNRNLTNYCSPIKERRYSLIILLRAAAGLFSGNKRRRRARAKERE